MLADMADLIHGVMLVWPWPLEGHQGHERRGQGSRSPDASSAIQQNLDRRICCTHAEHVGHLADDLVQVPEVAAVGMRCPLPIRDVHHAKITALEYCASVCACVDACAGIRACTYTRIHASKQASKHSRMHACTPAHMHALACACACMLTHAHVHVCACMSMHVQRVRMPTEGKIDGEANTCECVYGVSGRMERMHRWMDGVGGMVV